MSVTSRSAKRKRSSQSKRKRPFKPSKKPTKGVKRGARGRFKKGTAPGPGRPRKGEDAADYAEQSIGAEEVWTALARLIRRRSPSIRAIELYLAYRHGRPWSEAEILADREIKEAQARIDEARQKGNGNGDTERKVG
jgi:hypothetical protein